MKRRLSVFISLVMLLVVCVPVLSAQDRRRRSKFGRKARTAAIVAGGAGIGALAGGKKGAAIGAGGAGLYAFNRKAARRNFKGRTRTAGSTLSGAALGSGVGGAVGGKRAAVAGALLGAGGGYVVRRNRKNLRRR